MKTEGQGLDITRFINENGLEEQISVPFWVISSSYPAHVK